MMKTIISSILGFALLIFLSTGCSTGNEPEGATQNTEAAEGLTIADGQVELMEQSGHPLQDCKALFSLGWKEFFVPMLSTTETAGHAFAIAFDEPVSQRPRPFVGGIDIGSVFINYQTTQLEMQKLVGPQGGVVYSLGHRPRPGISNVLEFVPNTDYQFEVTGSANFDPLQISLTSPPALLNISSHVMGDTIDTTQDLTLIWSGGKTGSEIAVHIHPARLRPLGSQPAPGQIPLPGQRPPRGGPGQAGLMPPPPPLSPHSIFILLDNNPGTVTIPAADLQDLVSQTQAQGIICGISQIDLVEVNHNGEVVRAVLHNGDRVGLVVQ